MKTGVDSLFVKQIFSGAELVLLQQEIEVPFEVFGESILKRLECILQNLSSTLYCIPIVSDELAYGAHSGNIFGRQGSFISQTEHSKITWRSSPVRDQPTVSNPKFEGIIKPLRLLRGSQDIVIE